MKKFREAGAEGDKLAEKWEVMVEEFCTAFIQTEPELIKDLRDRMDGRYVSENFYVAVNKYLQDEREAILSNLGPLHNNSVENVLLDYESMVFQKIGLRFFLEI